MADLTTTNTAAGSKQEISGVLPVVFTRPAELLEADRTLTDADDEKVFLAGAVDLELVLHSPPATKIGFKVSVVVAVVSVTTGFTITGAINAGATSAVNTGATDALGDRFDLFWTGTAWVGQAVQGTWNVT
jgi:hypothetical protein